MDPRSRTATCRGAFLTYRAVRYGLSLFAGQVAQGYVPNTHERCLKPPWLDVHGWPAPSRARPLILSAFTACARQGGLAASFGAAGAGGLSAADLALASQMGLGSGAAALSAAAAASRGAFGEGPRIYVGGVPDLVTVAMVRDHFSRWGVVSGLTLVAHLLQAASTPAGPR